MTVAIVSVLAAVAVPYAEVGVRRSKEADLRRELREVRSAIDVFHKDWERGLIPAIADLASVDGYPRSLNTLVGPVRLSDGQERRYLRRVPRDPFGEPDLNPEDTWRLIGYRDSAEGSTWGEEDVWDIASKKDGTALDGTRYQDW